MIYLTIENGKLTLDQRAQEPVVYLDHAPLMDVAEHHAEEFQDALVQRNGTLAFSWLNLSELAAVGDPAATVSSQPQRQKKTCDEGEKT